MINVGIIGGRDTSKKALHFGLAQTAVRNLVGSLEGNLEIKFTFSICSNGEKNDKKEQLL